MCREWIGSVYEFVALSAGVKVSNPHGTAEMDFW
jgi:hypothetical protein